MFILGEDFERLGFTQGKLVFSYFGGSRVWLNGGNFVCRGLWACGEEFMLWVMTGIMET